jgi:hypothetical protein
MPAHDEVRTDEGADERRLLEVAAWDDGGVTKPVVCAAFPFADRQGLRAGYDRPRARQDRAGYGCGLNRLTDRGEIPSGPPGQ